MRITVESDGLNIMFRTVLAALDCSALSDAVITSWARMPSEPQRWVPARLKERGHEVEPKFAQRAKAPRAMLSAKDSER